MPRADGSFFNAWDRAKVTDEVWLSASSVSGGYRNGQYAPWRLHGPISKPFALEPAEKEKGWSPSHWPGGFHLFVTFDEAAAWAKEHLGITGWRRWKHGDYFPDPQGTDVACKGGGVKACTNKRKPGEELCGVHLGVKRRGAERAERWRERDERWRRDGQLSKDCREAAAKLNIPLKGRHVSMHAEDFLALCRELEELRGLREFL